MVARTRREQVFDIVRRGYTRSEAGCKRVFKSWKEVPFSWTVSRIILSPSNAQPNNFVAGERGIAPFSTGFSSGVGCVSPPAPPELNRSASFHS